MAQVYCENKEKEKMKIAEDSTKIVWRVPCKLYEVIAEIKNTEPIGKPFTPEKWHGITKDSNVCDYLQFLGRECNIPISVIEKINDTSYRGKKVTMYPLKFVTCVVPIDPENNTEVEPIIEIHYTDKDGKVFKIRYNPKAWFDLYDVNEKLPSLENCLGEVPRDAFLPNMNELATIVSYQFKIFELVCWTYGQGLPLVKIECEYGKTPDADEIVLADVSFLPE